MAFLAQCTGAHIKKNLAISGLYGLPFLPFFLVEVVRLGVINAGPVALKTKRVALFNLFYTVNIVAITAAYVATVHLTLGKRAVNVNLFQDLAVGKIQIRCQQAGQHAVQQIRLGVGVISHNCTPGVTGCAQFHLLARIHPFGFDH